MRLLFALTYYRPHVSGLTIYVQRLAEALAARAHAVTVLTSRYNRALPREEVLGGVRVVRVPVALRLSKGTVSPSYLCHALPLVRRHDAVVASLPTNPSEAVLLPLLAHLLGRPVVATYHCDLELPAGAVNRAISAGVFASNVLSGALVDRLVAYTDEYARASIVLQRFPDKVEVIPPPVVIAEPNPAGVAAWRASRASRNEVLIGFVARFATEKGVEVLLRALPELRARLGPVRVLFAGEHENVIGESGYRERLKPLLDGAGEAWSFLGVLPPERLADFYGACDVTVLPSLNRTESFGLVQVESMLCGTPVVASDLPGVGVPVCTTGMGRTVPPGDPGALAEAIAEVHTNRTRYLRPRNEVERAFSLDRTVEHYEALLAALVAARRRSSEP